MKDSFSILGMYSDYNFQFTNLLFLLTPLAKAFYDSVLHEDRNLPTDHKLSLLIFSILGFIISIIDFHFSVAPHLLQSLLFQVSIFWCFFDYLDNWFSGKSWWYISTDTSSNSSWIERNVYSKLPSPIMWLFFKLWFLVLGFCVYYFFSYI